MNALACSARRPLAAALAAATALAACGPRQPTLRHYRWADRDPMTETMVDLQDAEMPAGQTMTGVYRSPQIGDIELVQSGDTVTGSYAYERAACHATGTIEGTVRGNLLEFRWSEDQRVCGRLGILRGRGYFLFSLDHNENVTVGRMFGRWGYGENVDTGGPWTLARINGQTPRALQNAAPAQSDTVVNTELNGTRR